MDTSFWNNQCSSADLMNWQRLIHNELKLGINNKTSNRIDEVLKAICVANRETNANRYCHNVETT